jgi:hypothetical protein
MIIVLRRGLSSGWGFDFNYTGRIRSTTPPDPNRAASLLRRRFRTLSTRLASAGLQISTSVINVTANAVGRTAVRKEERRC